MGFKFFLFRLSCAAYGRGYRDRITGAYRQENGNLMLSVTLQMLCDM